MIKGQHYKVPANRRHREHAKPGQHIFMDDDQTEPVGFIDFVSDCELAIMLFQPAFFNDDAPVTVIQEECDWEPRLREILDEDPEMWKLWEDGE